ncbi:LysR family substrate-binding domain-containing protein [Microbacterium sp. ZXX196]|uniref:LysR family substrate-binding domain-containing protein n=1 Tax=Microbacterium sp. ZXX196 TaxID=2609291 RepID=UPI0012B84279|nr:LysR family substrate-binding domain-containing protein [Microbacterium sp. ZXX196]MTE23584.1 transcriptional regulator [Microbacterium sp. ZXX196]
MARRNPPGRRQQRVAPARDTAPRPAPAPAPFRLGAIPGATPGKWIERWREQRPQQRLVLESVALVDQVAALRDRRVDACICRGPLAEDDLHVVRLYDEVPVVVMSAESSLAAADTLVASDLAGEVLIRSRDEAFEPAGLPTTPAAFAPLPTTEDAVATAASGVGIAVMPMSLARLHHRRDATFRPLEGVDGSAVVLAWLRACDDDDVQAFVAITRGRTARSSR